jgi:alpha-tubulin suppressor-like RCC1 family protein
MENVLEAAGGASHVIVVKRDGSLWGWGGNLEGQLALAGMHIPTPTEIPRFWKTSEEIVSIGCGMNYSWVITSEGNFWSWGLGQRLDAEFGEVRNARTPDQKKFPRNFRSQDSRFSGKKYSSGFF